MTSSNHDKESAMTEHTNPTVGMAATIGVGSDSYPAKVTYVSPSGKTVGATIVSYPPEAVVESRETGGMGWDKKIDVDFANVETIGAERRVRLQPDGRYRNKTTGGRVSLGVARDYRDPHF